MSSNSANRQPIHSDQTGRSGELMLQHIRPQVDYFLPQAHVGRWGYHETIIFCPYCHQNHIHPGTRMPDYSSPPTYDAPCRKRSSENCLSSLFATVNISAARRLFKYIFNKNRNKGKKSYPRDNAAGGGGDIHYQYQLAYPTNRYIQISSKKDREPYWVYPAWDQLAKNGQEVPREDSGTLTLNIDGATLRSDEHKAVLRSYAGIIKEWDLTGEFKTIGLLLRDPGVEPISTESGWAHRSNTHEGCHKIEKDMYAEGSLRRCAAEGFPLPEDEQDRGVPGRFSASFATMQLMNWYLENHVIIESDCISNPALSELKRIAPSWRIPVDMLVSRRTKPVCTRYARHIKSRYNVDFVERDPWSRF